MEMTKLCLSALHENEALFLPYCCYDCIISKEFLERQSAALIAAEKWFAEKKSSIEKMSVRSGRSSDVVAAIDAASSPYFAAPRKHTHANVARMSAALDCIGEYGLLLSNYISLCGDRQTLIAKSRILNQLRGAYANAAQPQDAALCDLASFIIELALTTEKHHHESSATPNMISVNKKFLFFNDPIVGDPKFYLKYFVSKSLQFDSIIDALYYISDRPDFFMRI